MATMPFGKYKGVSLSELPLEYLEWVIGRVVMKQSLRQALKVELKRRRTGSTESERLTEEIRLALPGVDFTAIISQCRRELAMKWHPDRGGDTQVMIGVNLALDRVQELLKSKQ